jgi:hypothetical protein
MFSFFKSFFNCKSNVSLNEKEKMYNPKNEDLDKLNLNSLIHILNEAKDFLNYTIEESNKITQRAFSFFSIFFSLISVVSGYAFINFEKKDSKLYMTFVLVFILFCLILYLFKIIFPREINPKGREPDEMFLESRLLTPKVSKEHNYTITIINEITSIQNKINKNKERNIKRINYLKTVLIISPIILLIYLIISFFVLIN